MKIVSNRPTITRKDLEAVLDSLINDELRAGESVKNFETGIARMIGLKHALATNSLTSAYHLVFTTLGITNGDEVIIPSFFSVAPLSALTMVGGKAVLLDNEENVPFPVPEEIKSKIGPKTKAIVLANHFGYHFPFGVLGKVQIPIIEDISHSIGTESDDTPSGMNGTFAVASFDPSGIITTGNGGMVLTGNSKYFSAMKELRGGNGRSINYEYTMTDFQGAMGVTQFMKLQNFINRRREIAKIYHQSLRLTSHKSLFNFSESFAYQTFPVLFDAAVGAIEKFWKKQRIELLRAISPPLHTLQGMDKLAYPNCERLSQKLFSVPLYPTLSKHNIEKISKALASFV